ncbi:MAG: hypothetical protein ACLP0J_03685 [Solirubrobacteraceae bacterium]
MPELIEAAVRSGSPERARAYIGGLSEIASAGGNDWSLGVAGRSHALLSEGDAAELLYLEAIERLGRTRVRAELARSHLVYGEWLRRQHRRTAAWMRGASCGSPTRCSPRWARWPSPSARVASCSRPARRFAGARTRRVMT